MAIVKMKKLRLLAVKSQCEDLMRELMLLGCVEITEPEEDFQAEAVPHLDRYSSGELARFRENQRMLTNALGILNGYVPEKKGMFQPKDQVGQSALLDESQLSERIDLAEKIILTEDQIRRRTAEESRLRSLAESLRPWQNMDVALDVAQTRTCSVLAGMIPSAVSAQAVENALTDEAPEAEIFWISQDREQHYALVVCHNEAKPAALEVLRTFSFSPAQFGELRGTARENIDRIQRQLAVMAEDKALMIEAISAKQDRRRDLTLASELMQTKLDRAEAENRLLCTEQAVSLEGWVPVSEEEQLSRCLSRYDCAWETEEPAPEDYPQVPVQLKNNFFTRPLNMVTEMYSLPAYDGVDPNPLMAPFFILFYGMMMADMGYGLLMILAGIVVSRRAKPGGTMGHLFKLLISCGVSTFLWGLATGGFFGDAPLQIVTIFNPNTTWAGLPRLFSPLDDALMVLIGSLALGIVQIFTGMGINFVKRVKRGETMAAVCDEGAWFVVFILLAVAAVTGAWNVCLIAVAVLLVLTQGYGKKGILGKITGVGGSLYNHVTGYFSDILSYSRLMALMLAGAVIAQVFNTLGAITGNIVGFLVISLIGNALNFALNLLGCFVHDLRLQCLEFFGRFYEDGGKPFRPLKMNTKYVNVVKE